MIDIIENHRSQLDDLCQKHRVKTLELFGSATEGTWNPKTSDLDFLVDFFPVSEEEIAPPFFSLLHDLEDLFERKIDLVMTRAIRNLYFLEGVNRTRKLIYAV